MKSSTIPSSSFRLSCASMFPVSLLLLILHASIFCRGQNSFSSPLPLLSPSWAGDSSAVRLPADGLAGIGSSVAMKPGKERIWFIAGVHATAWGGSLIILNNTWYKGYDRTGFHSFDDSGEWNQVDKTGHAWSAYNIGKISSGLWEWTGMPHRKAVLFGGLGSMAYLTGIEFMDAHSAKWGWSWSDIGANIGGAAIFTSQELLWGEQRIQYKFSFHNNRYDDPLLETRADDLYGKSWYERMLKDYNAQTYWMSANLASFWPKSGLPAWLNIAVGYGADGMYGGFDNKWTDALGSEIDRSFIPRKRQFYLAPDINFTKIPTRKKWLKTAFAVLNAFKCPAPALMLDSKGKFRAYALYF